jgi:hypothetical protein
MNMKNKIIGISWLFYFLTICSLEMGATIDSLSTKKYRNCVELGIRNFVNARDGNQWKSESNNIYSIISYTRYFDRLPLHVGVDYYHFETYKLSTSTADEDMFKVYQYREFKHLRLFAGVNMQNSRWIMAFQAHLNYMFAGMEGRYTGDYDSLHLFGNYPNRPNFGHSLHKGFGGGFGLDLKYIIKKRATAGISFNYGSYSLKRTYHKHIASLFNFPEDESQIENFNDMFTVHLKFGYLF